MTSKLGYNSRPNINYAPLLAQIKAQGGVAAHVFECYASELHRVRDFLPYVKLPIWRPVPEADWSAESIYLKVPATTWTEARIAELTAAGFKPGDVAIHLHNESSWTPDMLAWEHRAAQIAVNRGWSVVAVNTSVGTPPQDQIHLAKDLLNYAATHPDKVFMGIHEYFSVTGDNKVPWYIRRWVFWENVRRSLNVGEYRYVITEFGAEDISDDHTYTNTLPITNGKPIGAVHTLENAWKKLYGAAYKSLDEQYMCEIKTAFESGLYDDKRILGVCLFSWGVGGRWGDYDVSAMTILHGLIRGFNVPVLPDNTELPIETDPEIAPVPAIATENSIRVRNKAVTGSVIGEVNAGDVVNVLENSANIGVNGQWLKIRTANGLEGYTAAWFYKVPEPTPDPDPDPDPDDTTEIPGALYITRAEHEAAMENLRHELITFVEAKFATVIETVLTAEAKALLEYASKEHKEAIQLIDRRAS